MLKDMRVDSLMPNFRNAKTHSDEQIRKIAESINEFGFLNPILIDEDNIIIAGHARYAAARKLKLKEVPVLVVTGLTPEQIRAYCIADNRLAELGQWDNLILEEELLDLKNLGVDLDTLGWGDFNLDDEEKKPEKEKKFKSQFEVIVECRDEAEQEDLFNRFVAEGRKCRVLSI